MLPGDRMNSSSARDTIRIHGTELSTDHELFDPYAETIAMLVALVAVLAAAWAVATPAASADMLQVQPAPSTAPADAVQPHLDGAPATATLTPSSPASSPLVG
jgi:hypothetical protein